MKIKTLLFIFLIFSQSFVATFHECDLVLIDKSDYDFSFLQRGKSVSFPIFKNNKKIFAFDYYFLLNHLYYFIEDHAYHYYQEIYEISKKSNLFPNIFSRVPFLGVFVDYYNNKIINEKIEINKVRLYKIMELYKSIQKGIKNIEWIDNNIVLTAVSADDTCKSYNFKFDFYEDKRYIDSGGNYNHNDVITKMAKLTCNYKSKDNECDFDYCIDNLMQYLEYRKKKREGKTNIFKIFTNDCSIKNVII